MGKISTNVSIDCDLKFKAKEKGINLSKLLNNALKEELTILEKNKE